MEMIEVILVNARGNARIERIRRRVMDTRRKGDPA